MSQKISTESYKGVRDFYPEDMFVLNYIFDIWKKTVESFGYTQYDASILESAELYKAKSGEEIVNEQTYTFIDRGEREVTLRPEMTPTVARMVAAREKELPFPLRWFSIPNLFRYEKPQRGRLREHWQLNVDLFGIESKNADSEVIKIAYTIMKNYGAKDEDFIIRLNSRKILKDLYKHFSIPEDNSHKLSKIIDKKDKISEDIFKTSVEEVLGEKTKDFIRMISSNEILLNTLGSENKNVEDLVVLIETLEANGIKNIKFDPTLMRGFDYYTGTVFEVFDTSPENNRSIFGGGRYDDLLDIFGSQKVPAIGFGAGDVTARDFLETHNLLPHYTSSSRLFIGTVKEEFIQNAQYLANALRSEGINVTVNLTNKKIGDQVKLALKQKVPYFLAIGDYEIKSDKYTLKHLESENENKVTVSEIVEIIKKTQ
ncbi:MAG: histidine--tRNA ligase [Candidatus Paceibacterota bacterium]